MGGQCLGHRAVSFDASMELISTKRSMKSWYMLSLLCSSDSSGAHRLVYVLLECIRRGHWGTSHIGYAALFSPVT
jgi:hypothetical protein